MLKNLNATKKGLVTGLMMIALSLLFYFTKQPFDSPTQYLIYLLYAFGIVWTLYDFQRTADKSAKFGEYFLQGFKCFIVVTLLMALFTIGFNLLHPEFKAEGAAAYREQLLKEGNKTLPEIEANIKKMKELYMPILIAQAIFSYLFIGAFVTLVSSLLFRSRK